MLENILGAVALLLMGGLGWAYGVYGLLAGFGLTILFYLIVLGFVFSISGVERRPKADPGHLADDKKE